ncbi:protein kinase subdomain-containing protein PKL/CAK/Fmp29 [Pisolithus croceorrhizus]|nr:protein kinase subdomain-containing protein PKL/CAK/Fmp29 [Pisolithus croceorrhizus]
MARSGSVFTSNFPAVPVWPSLCRPCSSLSSFLASSTANPDLLAATSRFHACYSIGNMSSPQSNMFSYNNDLCLEERTGFFNSVGRRRDDVAGLQKIAEGGFNRTFLITMHDGFQMVARIPYPVTVPKSFAIASEVATMTFLRSRGLPIPEVFDYSPKLDNTAGTEYIFMAYVNGDSLDNIWHDLTEEQIDSFFRQFAEIEAKMILYFTKDLKTLLAGKDDKSCCMGPDASVPLWFGRRSELDLDRGPYANAEAALEGVAKKELAFLQKFGQPLLPFQRERREACRPLGSNDLRIVAIIDFQHTPILPMFLLAGVPQSLQNYDDLYLRNAAKYNEPRPMALEDSMGVLRRRLFFHAKNPWEGETLALKVALIKLTENWKTLVREDLPCPVELDPADAGKMMALHAEQKKADKNLEMARSEKLKRHVLEFAETEEEWNEIMENWPLDDMDERDYM